MIAASWRILQHRLPEPVSLHVRCATFVRCLPLFVSKALKIPYGMIMYFGYRRLRIRNLSTFVVICQLWLYGLSSLLSRGRYFSLFCTRVMPFCAASRAKQCARRGADNRFAVFPIVSLGNYPAQVRTIHGAASSLLSSGTKPSLAAFTSFFLTKVRGTLSSSTPLDPVSCLNGVPYAPYKNALLQNSQNPILPSGPVLGR